ncbi:MAG: phosphotransferase [Firmicutes bacterium]|nr:phosphotransferase [Bacillota bacterium]
MIDIHAHILPGFDDGAHSIAEAVEMAYQAYEDGITAAIATPHILDPRRDHREKILAAVEKMRVVFAERRARLEIFPGAEVHIDPCLPELVAAGKVMTMNDAGRYLLLELPLGEMPGYTEEVTFGLVPLGGTPIIAHPERNRDLARDVRLLRRLVEQGCLVQLSTGSIRGRFGREAERAAKVFLREGLVHFLGTDAHGADRRRPRMAEAAAKITEACGPEWARTLVEENPRRLLAGLPVQAEKVTPGSSSASRGVLGFLRRVGAAFLPRLWK